ncbi:MAG: hypothetical protein RQ826_01835 [Xanthomonadales bacterium]|nr:hypothetical protein [Xanthomonadales bacterium]
MKSIDQPSKAVRRQQQIRREITAEAARILATEGQRNYHAAKKKAAQRIGVSDRVALPSNIEVKDALQSYLLLYGGAAHLENLDRLRASAATVMQALEEFRPRLVGPVLDGTADPHSRISLHVFCDSPDQLVLYFLEKSITFKQEQRKIRWFDGSYRTMPLIVFDFEDTVMVELMVFDAVNLRQAPPSPVDGKPQPRANLAEVECLLSGPPSPVDEL